MAVCLAVCLQFFPSMYDTNHNVYVHACSMQDGMQDGTQHGTQQQQQQQQQYWYSPKLYTAAPPETCSAAQQQPFCSVEQQQATSSNEVFRLKVCFVCLYPYMNNKFHSVVSHNAV